MTEMPQIKACLLLTVTLGRVFSDHDVFAGEGLSVLSGQRILPSNYKKPQQSILHRFLEEYFWEILECHRVLSVVLETSSS